MEGTAGGAGRGAARRATPPGRPGSGLAAAAGGLPAWSATQNHCHMPVVQITHRPVSKLDVAGLSAQLLTFTMCMILKAEALIRELHECSLVCAYLTLAKAVY